MNLNKEIQKVLKEYWSEIGIEEELLKKLVKEGKAKGMIEYYEDVNGFLENKLTEIANKTWKSVKVAPEYITGERLYRRNEIVEEQEARKNKFFNKD